MSVKTFEETLESVKNGARPNSSEVDSAILNKAQEEWNQEHPEDKFEVKTEKTPEPAPEPEVKEPEAKEPEPKPEEKEPEVKLTEDEVLSAKEDTLSDSDKLRKLEILKTREEAEKKEVALYAQAEGLTEEEAKKAIEAEKKLAEQYQNDPRKLSRTARYWQSQHMRLEARVKAESEAKERSVKDNEIIIQGKKMSFEQAKPLMIEAYRNEFAEKVADKSDEEVFETAKKDYQARIKAYYAEQGKKIADQANSKRARIVLELPDHAKPFRQEIEASLGLLPDSKIVQEDYSPEDIIAWARGRHYSPEKIKEMEDAAFKRGQENAKILGEKVTPSPASSSKNGKPPAPSADKEIELLTKDQKDQALNMFDGIKVWDEQRKFKEFISVMKETGRWNPKKENS